MTYASLVRRLAAYLVDIVPITFVVAAASVILLGVDLGSTSRRASDSGLTENRVAFLEQRDRIRDGSFALWIVYGAILEGSALKGTLGKRWLGIKVVDASGERLSFTRSSACNLARILSLLPFGLGLIWALFRRDRRTWHDLVAGTYVVRLQAWD